MSSLGSLVGRLANQPLTSVGTGSGLLPPIPLGRSFTGEGTAGNDVVHVSKCPGTLLGVQFYDVEINGRHFAVTKDRLESMVFDLGAGDDKLIVDADVDANITAHGGSGDDTMVGGAGNDRFDGGSGDDRLTGGDGNDVLKGGSGDDYVSGDRGRDRLDGGDGINSVLRDAADFNAEIALRNPDLFQDYADRVSTVTNREPRRYGA